jgi:hypothetical protein
MVKRRISLLLFHITLGLFNGFLLSLLSILFLLALGFSQINLLFWIALGANVLAIPFYILAGVAARRVPQEVSLRILALRPATLFAVLIGLFIGSRFESFSIGLVTSFPLYYAFKAVAKKSISLFDEILENCLDVPWVAIDSTQSQGNQTKLFEVRWGYLFLAFPIMFSSLVIWTGLPSFGFGLKDWDLVVLRVILWFLALAILFIVWISEFNRTIKSKFFPLNTESASYVIRMIFQVAPSVYGLIAYLLGAPQIDLILLCTLSFVSIAVFQFRFEMHLVSRHS